MNRPFLAALAVAALCLGGAVPLQAVPTGEKPMTLSVLYFENLTGDEATAWLSKGLSDMLVSDLSGHGALRLVERERLEKLLVEMELDMSGLMDPANAGRNAGFLEADALLYGSYAVTGDEVRVDARMVEVETSLILATASARGRLDDLSRVEWDLSAKIAGDLGLRAGTPVTVPTVALRSYYRGLDLMDKGKYADAVAFFGESVKVDPLFLKPGKGLENAWRYLKKFKEQRWRREMNALAEDINAMTARLGAPVFYSFADALMNPGAFGFADAAAVNRAYQEHPARMNGDTPVMAVWNLQMAFSELADKAEEYFEDQALAERCRDEILLWTRRARKEYPGDANLPEVLYQNLFVFREREQWQELKVACEELMEHWPDYRMSWAIEDMYESALEKLGGE